MKKIVLILVFVVSAAIGFNSCSGASSTNKTEQTMKTVYTCSMHPEVELDKPGKCPKCGMELIEKKVESTKDTTNHEEHKHSM